MRFTSIAVLCVKNPGNENENENEIRQSESDTLSDVSVQHTKTCLCPLHSNSQNENFVCKTFLFRPFRFWRNYALADSPSRRRASIVLIWSVIWQTAVLRRSCRSCGTYAVRWIPCVTPYWRSHQTDSSAASCHQPPQLRTALQHIVLRVTVTDTRMAKQLWHAIFGCSRTSFETVLEINKVIIWKLCKNVWTCNRVHQN